VIPQTEILLESCRTGPGATPLYTEFLDVLHLWAWLIEVIMLVAGDFRMSMPTLAPPSCRGPAKRSLRPTPTLFPLDEARFQCHPQA
jgi:hypothetical protein